MPKNLVIVESPAKAKTIEKFLGKDFMVRSCYGHIRDLAKDDTGIDVENGFLPLYQVPDDKKQVVSDLKKLAADAKTVWLASDEDREGEAIAWHLFETLKLKEQKTRRIVFHEITKNAILKAIQTPRGIDYNLVNAQQARRVLDRLVGFELSPVLWRKVKPSLSAGRVQSVAVRLIVEREKEINVFDSSFAFRVTADFYVGDEKDGANRKILSAELPVRFDSEEKALAFLEKCVPASYRIDNLETKPAKKTPAAPFTTSTLQQEASRKLGFSISQTMTLAQKLYESGHITYMRTDSVNLSEFALEAAKNEILASYGEKYVHTQTYTTKSAGAQEAHEAIRPTDFSKREISGDKGAARLYELIWKRSIASQMSDARLERTIATIGISTTSEQFVATGEVLKFDGFLAVYLESNDDEGDEDQSKMLPPLVIGEKVDLKQMLATQRFSKPPARFTEASLVKKLEELGIGRPSTYAPTISTIQKRGYVVKEDRDGKTRTISVLSLHNGAIKSAKQEEKYGAEKAKLFPTDIGTVVNDFLTQHFGDILDYNFTATVEKDFDEIAQGKMVWNSMIGDFYKPFHATVEKTLGSAERQSGARLLGKDSASDKNVYAKIGRFGAMIQIGEQGDSDLRFAKMQTGQSIETITLNEAMTLFKLPRSVGEFEDKDVRIGVGRFGPYVQHDGKYCSLSKEDDPYSIDLDRAVELILAKRSEETGSVVGWFEDKEMTTGKGRFGPYVLHDKKYYSLPRGESLDGLTEKRAVEIIEAKRQSESEKVIREYPENPSVKVLNGRFGPYIAIGKKNIKIPKDKKPEELTLADCLLLAGDIIIPKSAATKKSTTKNSAESTPTKAVKRKSRTV